MITVSTRQDGKAAPPSGYPTDPVVETGGLPVGSPEAAQAIERAMAKLTNRKANRDAQVPGVYGRRTLGRKDEE